jgi:hypothetical protein
MIAWEGINIKPCREVNHHPIRQFPRQPGAFLNGLPQKRFSGYLIGSIEDAVNTLCHFSAHVHMADAYLYDAQSLDDRGYFAG